MRPPFYIAFFGYSLHFSLLCVPTVVTVVVNASAFHTIAVAVAVIVTVSAPFAHCPSVLLCVAVAAVIAAAASSLLLVDCWLLPGCC